VRALVLAGDCGGADDADVRGDAFACFAEAPKPVIAVVKGEATGAGLALVLAADIRVAERGARFSLTEVASGGLPVGGSMQRLARLVGRGKALELILTGEAIDAEEALRIGLVSEVVPDAQARAQEIAERIVERGPLAVQYAKEAVSRGLEMPLEQALRFETDLTVILQTTEDRAEGVRAFREKRKPRFRGN
jgi:enoyl-CoA hydratase/carnithine racemase